MLTKLVHRLVALPGVYDAVQNLAGAQKSIRRMQAHFNDIGEGSILDVGAGTGNLAAAIPASAQYIWLDNDPLKLRGFQAKHPRGLIILGDACRIPLRDKSVDVALCIAMAHHLTEAGVSALIGELARVCRNKLIFLDPVERKSSLVSRLLWRYDRGSYPRPIESLKQLIQKSFEIQHYESYAIWHQYVLCTAHPKR